MEDNSPYTSFIDPHLRVAHQQFIRDNPSNRRLSQAEKATIINWTTKSEKQNLSQQEFSRRHYARKTFQWDGENQCLWAVPKHANGPRRAVVTESEILDTIEDVHNTINHAGWDATWKEVSRVYYGILRIDVIFLLKQCPACADNPRKKPKNMSNTSTIDPRHFHVDNRLSIEHLLADEFAGYSEDYPSYQEYPTYQT